MGNKGVDLGGWGKIKREIKVRVWDIMDTYVKGIWT